MLPSGCFYFSWEKAHSYFFQNRTSHFHFVKARAVCDKSSVLSVTCIFERSVIVVVVFFSLLWFKQPQFVAVDILAGLSVL